MVHENTEEENYVIGITIEGTAELVGEVLPKSIGEAYVAKHKKANSLLEDIRTGKNLHKFYKLKAEKIVLFDNKDFPDDPRQEIEIT